jgi:hypothetical protein
MVIAWRKIHKNQSGIVAIMVTIIVMLVISLIVLGFANIVRREQRQSLDRQLNTQAFYVAESGVNYAVQQIKDLGLSAAPIADKDDCGSDAVFPGPGGSYDIDPANNVKISCLLVDPSPPSLKYDHIGTDQSRIIPVRSADGSPINTITFSWEDTDDATTSAATCASNFPRAVSWSASCGAGILRFDLVPTPPSGFDRSFLINSTMTAFLRPRPGGVSTLSYGSATTGLNGQGAAPEVKCNGTGAHLCTLTVDSLGAISYLIRVKSIYKPNKLTITANTDIIGTQAVIDSTGKANDVLRRIQVRVPTTNLSDDLFPEFAIQSVETICKRFTSALGIAPTFSGLACTP